MMEKIRGFEMVSENMRKNTTNAILPKRGTMNSAGYDFATPLNIIIPPKSKKTIWTNIKSYMKDSEVLLIYIRSSLGINKGLYLANGTGVIDSDYYNNLSNEGNIGICLVNSTNEPINLKEGERIAQGIFMPFLISDNGNTSIPRDGGIGSTSKKEKL